MCGAAAAILQHLLQQVDPMDGPVLHAAAAAAAVLSVDCLRVLDLQLQMPPPHHQPVLLLVSRVMCCVLTPAAETWA